MNAHNKILEQTSIDDSMIKNAYATINHFNVTILNDSQISKDQTTYQYYTQIAKMIIDQLHPHICIFGNSVYMYDDQSKLIQRLFTYNDHNIQGILHYQYPKMQQSTYVRIYHLIHQLDDPHIDRFDTSSNLIDKSIFTTPEKEYEFLNN